jgi:acetyl-CoA C-acetyltransferase
MERVVITSGVRTAIGTFGGSLKNVPVSDLGAIVTKEAIKRSGLQARDIGEVVFGCVGQIGEKAYLARVAAIKAGLPIETTAMTVNRLCASGLQAIITGAQTIQTGMASTVVAGGAENMSTLPFLDYERRWGRKMGEVAVQDALSDILSDPFEKYAMGVTAENVAEKYKVSREEQDLFAYESQQKAVQAIKNGVFKEQIIPVEVSKGRGKTKWFDTDEHPKEETSVEILSSLRTVFKKDGTVTAGNASGINDGASAVVMMSESEAIRKGLKPKVAIKGYAFSGVEPSLMGIGPISAVRKVLKNADLTIDDIGLIESNEAFAAQCIAVSKTLELDMQRVNVNGGAIALGHPIGATGNILAVKLMSEMEKRDVRYGLVTMCIGGGQGCAVIFEKYN